MSALNTVSHSRRVAVGAFLLATFMLLFCVNHSMGQSLITGSISGTVKDPTPAVVPNVAVSLLSLDTGATQSATTNSEGVYHFSLLKPGRYQVSVAVHGFSKVVSSGSVVVGQTTTLDVNLEVSKALETIEVTGEAPLINTDPGAVTNYTPKEVALLPSAGGDITTIAFTSPGVVVAQGSGYGNFSVNGLPGTSNLFTVNGENFMDPYFNISNSGATNLALGMNDMQEATIVTNPYSGQYGQLSGAQINYVTKSGTNEFHGNANYYWNGRALNANDFFANASQSPRPFANANQWAASLGGPVIKDHTWFFIDTEGMRFVLPVPTTQYVPTTAFANAVLNNIQANQPAELAAYQNMFNIYANAAKGKVVAPQAAAGTECAGVSIPGFANAGSSSPTPCIQSFFTSPTAFAKEWILVGRVDQKLTSKDNIFFQFKIDKGLQPTTTDPLNSAFNADSNQPEYDYQVQETHVFGPNMTNSFLAALSHYVAQFAQNVPQWQSAFPYGGVAFGFGGGFSNLNAQASVFPQGRNITQYQFVDDLSWNRGNHNLKFGVNFRRYDVSDHNFYNTYPLTIYGDLASGAGTPGMQAFANGQAVEYEQQLSPSTDVPVAIYGIGFYAEDQWKIRSNFTLTAALRFEKNGNPVCQTNCFPNFMASFPNLATVQAGAGAGDIPYSSDINTNLHSAYMGVDPINVSPRLAFSWSPLSDNKTVVSGGIGIFYDNPAATMVDSLLGNPPASVLFGIVPLDSAGAPKGILPFDAANGGPAAFAAASSAFSVNKSFNQLSTQLSPIIGFFPPVSFTSIQGTIHSPQVQEWNLMVERQLGATTAVSVNYVGNHSIDLPYRDAWWNAYATNSVFQGTPGFRSAAVVPNYGTVTTLQSGANSNYNGVTFSLREQYHNWFMAHANYTYSHTLDETSNGGLVPIGNFGTIGYPGAGIQTQLNPGSLRANNYGNADYDIRNLFNADYVITPTLHFENRYLKGLLGGWQWSGKVYIHSGLPFSVVDGLAGGATNQYGGVIMAQQIAPTASTSCGGGSVSTNGAASFGTTACLNEAAFANTSTSGFAYSKYPNQTRNQFRGPGYVDFDMGLNKTFQFKERYNLLVGATAFNVFNHPNFNLPDSNLGDATFGQVAATQGVPVSPYGNFLGFDSAVRVVQLTAKFTF